METQSSPPPTSGTRGGVDPPSAARFGGSLFGNAGIRARLEEHFNRDDAPGGGFLLHGLTGVGKCTTAFRLTKRLLAPKDARSLPWDGINALTSSRLVEDLSHPDLVYLVAGMPSPDGTPSAETVISTRWMRFALRKCALTSSTPEGYRVMIIDGAETLHPSASNALLKTLEEPPPRVVFFLLAPTIASVMPTIVSRCARFRFAPLTPQETVDAVSQTPRENATAFDPSDPSVTLGLEIAGGSVGMFRRLMDRDVGAATNAIVAFLANDHPHNPADNLQPQDGWFLSTILQWLCHTLLECRIRERVAGPEGIDAQTSWSKLLRPSPAVLSEACDRLLTRVQDIHPPMMIPPATSLAVGVHEFRRLAGLG